ncbi:MAG: GNAT family N-acetyltransferase [Candidatus Heimdallarchaeota archaeon]|nr:GNAT family N-acetyltransferase [Candidatus Heimdallarchaeota archaeon]
MTKKIIDKQRLHFMPVTPANWTDFEILFTQLGLLKGCWCMYWRRSRAEFNREFGEGNKKAMKEIIFSGKVPGLIAYYKYEPIGWCSIAPREDFPVLNRSPKLKPVDNLSVWSIICLFVAKEYREQGLTTELVKASIAYAKDNGAKIIEAYSIIPESSSNPKYEAYTGIKSTFDRLGFKVIIQRSKIRSIMRINLYEW